MNESKTNKTVAAIVRSRIGEVRKAFTLIELLVTISVILLLAALTVGGVTRATKSAGEARVRAELNQLVTAIESYQADLGVYPPDNGDLALTRSDRAARNPLYYELMGTVVDNQNGQFRTGDGSETIGVARIKNRFGVDGFQNAVTDPAKVRNYLRELKGTQRAKFTSDPTDVEVLKVHLQWPLKSTQPPIPENPALNPWRYLVASPNNSTNHNLDSYDLWAEYVDGKHVRVLGNWRSEAFIDRDFQ